MRRHYLYDGLAVCAWDIGAPRLCRALVTGVALVGAIRCNLSRHIAFPVETLTLTGDPP
ncbi:hypothetical protein BREVUG8_90119 [Brevundimonas sp. G8]|nr:hypothetical protein BREVUG8_90119 [Brevundimonas sp. G8]